MESAAPSPSLATLLGDWRIQLQHWAASGAFTMAALEALQLSQVPTQAPTALLQLTAQLVAGDTAALPAVELLPAEAMGGALGAYAISTGTIYLNASWLQSANQAQVLAVLTEELGHHLDGLLNSRDTPGDEGELFAALLLGQALTAEQLATLRAEDDRGVVQVNGVAVAVEQAATVQVALSPVATVTEDGPESLHVVFSRTGDVSAALTVNFAVAGSAGVNDRDTQVPELG